jgi:WD40 repeat protein
MNENVTNGKLEIPFMTIPGQKLFTMSISRKASDKILEKPSVLPHVESRIIELVVNGVSLDKSVKIFRFRYSKDSVGEKWFDSEILYSVDKPMGPEP